TAAEMTLDGLLHPQRLGRLPVQRSRNADHPGLALVLDPLLEHANQLAKNRKSIAETMIARRVLATIVESMLSSASNSSARQDVRAALRQGIGNLTRDLEAHVKNNEAGNDAEVDLLIARMKQFLARPDIDDNATPTLSPPPGSPIGTSFEIR
ncbi:MAG: hypothetical protein AAGJ83_10630, partial [Planctomycetota bacterium]